MFINSSQFQSFAVVEGRVPAAMMDTNRVFPRDLVEVMQIKGAIVFYFGVVKKMPFNPKARGSFGGLGAELIDDAGDGDELDFKGIADEDAIKQDVAFGVIVAIDEAWHDRHLLGVDRVSALPDECFRLQCAPHEDEAGTLHCKGCRPGHTRIDGVNPGVENHQVGVSRIKVGDVSLGNRIRTQQTLGGQAEGAGCCQTQEFPAVRTISFHGSSELSVLVQND
jgi:hypothetical protein